MAHDPLKIRRAALVHHICQLLAPYGQNPQNREKEGFGVENPPIPTTPEKGVLSQKIPFLYREARETLGILLTQNSLSEMKGDGVFQPQDPLFLILWVFTCPSYVLFVTSDDVSRIGENHNHRIFANLIGCSFFGKCSPQTSIHLSHYELLTNQPWSQVITSPQKGVR